MAGATGLEPAASHVTGRRSNQQNYAPIDRIPYTHCTCPPVPFDFPKLSKTLQTSLYFQTARESDGLSDIRSGTHLRLDP